MVSRCRASAHIDVYVPKSLGLYLCPARVDLACVFHGGIEVPMDLTLGALTSVLHGARTSLGAQVVARSIGFLKAYRNASEHKMPRTSSSQMVQKTSPDEGGLGSTMQGVSAT